MYRSWITPAAFLQAEAVRFVSTTPVLGRVGIKLARCEFEYPNACQWLVASRGD